MAGHSKFKNIQFRKGAQDKKRSKLFSKLGREITAAAKMGMPDPAMNPRLRTAVSSGARREHAQGQYRAGHQEEPGGRRRELRGLALRGLRRRRCRRDRRGAHRQPQPHRKRGALDLHQVRRQSRRDRRCVLQFRQARRHRVRCRKGDAPTRCWKPAIEAGADDCESERGRATSSIAIRTAASGGQGARGRASASRARSQIIWRAKTEVPIDEESGQKLLRMIDALEESDDVQQVYANFEIADELLERLSA